MALLKGTESGQALINMFWVTAAGQPEGNSYEIKLLRFRREITGIQHKYSKASLATVIKQLSGMQGRRAQYSFTVVMIGVFYSFFLVFVIPQPEHYKFAQYTKSFLCLSLFDC